ncbi:glycoside hydrolase family 140 protein [Planctomicrobium sp. SH668]|uniref:glycoside hydrolase family 140 protein n=1 Tax=Planctomicrobium sp. SH668 TaxID=3448126 RepID=UPI003F5CAAE2
MKNILHKQRSLFQLICSTGFCLLGLWTGILLAQETVRPAASDGSVTTSPAQNVLASPPNPAEASKPSEPKKPTETPAAEKKEPVPRAIVPHQRLMVSSDGRYLQTVNGEPFFYLADTAWELFHRLNREDAAKYLEDRAAKGFTVIQVAVLAENDGLNLPNAYGHCPLIDNDPSRPDIQPGPDNDYWDHVDAIVNMAAEKGLFIAMVPTWGDKWCKLDGTGPEIFTPTNAAKYGEWLGKRYLEQPVIWLLGGDRDPINEVQVDIVRQMAAGLQLGDGGAHLKTFYPQATSNSAQFFHTDEWLGFNMIQSGQARPVRPNYIDAAKNLNRTPVKPTLDGAPCYEDHPVFGEKWDKRETSKQLIDWFDEWDVRKSAYESMISGACGHTYGNNNIWQFWTPEITPIYLARTPWKDALNHPGAIQMQHLKKLFTARPFWNLRADQTLIVKDEADEENHAQAALSRLGNYALVYLPTGMPVTLKFEKMTSSEVRCSWFNPRQNSTQVIGTFAKTTDLKFTPPTSGRNNDWILVLDDPAAMLPRIGSSH